MAMVMMMVMMVMWHHYATAANFDSRLRHCLDASRFLDIKTILHNDFVARSFANYALCDDGVLLLAQVDVVFDPASCLGAKVLDVAVAVAGTVMVMVMVVVATAVAVAMVVVAESVPEVGFGFFAFAEQRPAA